MHLIRVSGCIVSATIAAASPAASDVTWKTNAPHVRLICPRLAGPTAEIVPATVNGYCAESFGWTIPLSAEPAAGDLNIVVGNESNNPVLAELASGRLDLDRSDLGPEGFRIVSHESGGRRYVVVTADSPVGLKHGCQELVYFHLRVTPEKVHVDWPLDLRRKPQFAYRGVYMLPCWSAHDALESWERVLRFHSELTLNRNWFWLAGFPLLKDYGGEYTGTDLADVGNVRRLVDLCRQEGMKFHIGGGWFTWHHEKVVGSSIDRGIQYYLDLVELLPGVEGIYLEPPGEGYEVSAEVWKTRTDAMRRLMETIWRSRPEFEFALAIGNFNAAEYRRAVHEIDDHRIFWWWCWGDPLRDKALDQHPLVLRWHTTVQMSNYHGSTQPPHPAESVLTGYATSYDPGQGYGNPWNGWGKLGVDRPRNVDPRTMPFFSHQYLFRERCWDLEITRERFAERLGRRLFDADMPPEAIHLYLELANLCPEPAKADPAAIARIDRFVRAHAGRGTPRNRDTLGRMAEALDGIRRIRSRSPASGPAATAPQ